MLRVCIFYAYRVHAYGHGVYILHAYYGWYMHLGLNYSCYSMIHMKNFIGLLYLEIFISSGQLDKS